MSLAWLAYLPLPGLAFVPALVEGHDRFARFHAWQGGILVTGFWLGLILIGLFGRISDAGGFQLFVGAISLIWILACLTGIIWGLVGAARGTFARIRPAYDLLAAMGR